MGLACSQIMLLSLTARKADCEYGISIDSVRKMALTREMSELSSEYYSKLKTKQYSYYANGRYNKLNYEYLMGNGIDYTPITYENSSRTLKSKNNMVLTDYKGQVVLNNYYANAITKVLGNNAISGNGRGGTFSTSYIPEMMAAIEYSPISASVYKTVMEGGQVPSSIATSVVQTLSGNSKNESRNVDNVANATELVQKLIDFYLPIFSAAAANGWTTEYNSYINENEDYVNDALVTGSLQLALVDCDGQYNEDVSTMYFVTSGAIDTNAGAEAREEITAWYNAEKARITEKENYLDIHMSDLSTELESINTEIQSIQSFIDDAVSSVFDWGSS